MSNVLRRRAALALCVWLARGLALAAAGCGGSARSATTASSEPPASGSSSLLMYAGAASKPPTEEAIQLFEEKTGVKVDVIFGGSGKVLSQMKLVKEGDLYFPGSSDYMEKAKKDGDVIAETEDIITYLVPAINVQAGNPRGIQTLKDLTQPGLKVAIADPDTVCVGLYAVEIIEQNFSADEKAAFRANLLNYTESCEKTATAVALKQVDAVLGWSVFQDWDPETIQTIPLDTSQFPRVGYIPIAVSSYTTQRDLAQQFIDFLTGAEGQAIFAKYGYFATPQEAFSFIGEEKPVGGEYVLPADWVSE
jgi:molybdate transport system substrate-binding protein